MNNNILQDKKAILHVFAGLMENPSIFKKKEYNLTLDDFPEKFHQIIFGVMYNLAQQGVEKISPVTIDGALSEFPNQYRIYNENNGLEYLEKLENIGEPDNFDYYYNRVKKYSFLRACKNCGIDISDIYDENLLDVKEIEAQQKKFDDLSLEDMYYIVEKKVNNLKNTFMYNVYSSGGHMSENIREILQAKREAPSYGFNSLSGYLNTIARGLRLRKIYLFSGPTGSGKSRFILGNTLKTCIHTIYNSETQKWEPTGAKGRGLFITTELDEEECKIPALAYIADIEESKIHDNKLTDEENERLDKAAQILETSPIWFEELHDFEISDIEAVIEKHVTENDINIVGFDYIHTSLKLLMGLSRQGIKNLREDQVLLWLGIALKDLCNKHNIFIITGTQLNNNYKEEDSLDQSTIRGSKALADKMDVAAIMLPITRKDEDIINSVRHSNVNESFSYEPTHSINVYKNRGNRYKSVRIWVHFDTGTLKMHDCFITDYRGNLITDIKPTIIRTLEEPSEPELEVDNLPDFGMSEQEQRYTFGF